VGTRSGIYRRKENTYEIVKLDSSISQEYLQVKLPLHVDELCNVVGGDIIFIEGEKSAGKSAFCIETAYLNRHLFKNHMVRYMQNGELNQKRATKRWLKRPQDVYPIEKWNEKIDIIRRTSDWWDIIDPDGLNVIDYIEEHNKKYLIPEYISNIQNKLRNGLAVIAVQRVPGRDFGTGGAEIRNKPTVIVSLRRPNKIVVEDIKDYDEDYIFEKYQAGNPQGMWKTYKLVSGWSFRQNSDWRLPGDKEELLKYPSKTDKDDIFVHEEEE
jgi:hypothetical protein